MGSTRASLEIIYRENGDDGLLTVREPGGYSVSEWFSGVSHRRSIARIYLFLTLYFSVV